LPCIQDPDQSIILIIQDEIIFLFDQSMNTKMNYSVQTIVAAPPPPQVSIRCPCGRRVLHTALREGEPDPPLLPCTQDCQVAARRAALADAFGVRNPDTYVPFFERHRDVRFSNALLQVCKSGSEGL
jgi:hypothetical protein